MDLDFSPEDEAFRAEVRAFVQDNLPEALRRKAELGQGLDKAETESWHAALQARGWLAGHWPRAEGGPGWSVMQKLIFEEELAMAGAPQPASFGLSMLGPVLIRFGSPAQKAHWLPRILDGSDWWCQGYSEPGAGSDLAAIRTTARREGDHYIVNGQKTWTTYAQHANMMFALVRTDGSGKRQEGISFLLIDMASPGVEVRPIRLLDGGSEVNEVFLTDVRVPLANLVGEEHQGWSYAKFLLTYERTGIAAIGPALAAFARLRRIAARRLRNGQPLDRDPLFAARLARLEIALENTRITNLRVLSQTGAGKAPVAESSMLKIRGSELMQQIADLTRRAAGPQALPLAGAAVGQAETRSAAARYFNLRKLSIYGGSNEIQREIISKSILEL